MRVRDSDMSEQGDWDSFFDAECVIEKLHGENVCHGNVVEFGSGYGTFTFPAARHTTGTVRALDIEADLIEQLQLKSKDLAIQNIQAEVRDFVEDGTGLKSGTQCHAMIYNLLHLENPIDLLKEAWRVLQAGGTLSVIHWRTDISTPKGPALDIRPTPEQCKEWIEKAGFRLIRDIDISSCCQYHFGIVAIR